ncbi:DNA repair protein RadC [Acaryochloris sp. CCMEE 5410]|uniref:RadC family protein n=1 Tax=Acaryochloris sp. CCMEE 5410 TaxID=310037 RepID=UPI0002E30942|nr:DNA repair protein RadC [Acaryochloris sp. CCMEE 5410]KAI9130121.1 DNA repair protein RadC [Acaryochloris sp. CCMEE 5410]
MANAILHIRDLPVEDRPRERLMNNGANQLSSAELLTILLGTGQGPGKLSAMGLGQSLLKELNQDQDPLKRLRQITPEELTQIHGIGQAKAATILAAIELGRRVHHPSPNLGTIIDDPSVAVEALSEHLMGQIKEKFAVLLLDVKHRLLGTHIVSVGTATETLAHPREIFGEIIRRGASRAIIAHNHPSGMADPSQDDITLTRQLLDAAKIMGIPILDHLVIGNGSFTSLRQTTSLWEDVTE